MKRKNILLSMLLSAAVLMCSACADEVLTTTVISSDAITSDSAIVTEVKTTTESETTTEAEITAATENESETTTAVIETESTTISDTTTESETTTTVIETQSETTSAVTQTAETTTSVTTTEAETTTTVTETEATTTATESQQNSTEVTEMTEAVTTNEVTEKKYIALTFDDGPNTTTTNEVLDVLEKYNIVASFFLIGNNINADNESVVKRAYDMGCEIGNHSKTHSNMTEFTNEEIIAEIDYVNDYIERITGEKPKFFRPPYISVNDRMLETIEMPFIAGFGANDWEERIPAERRANMILKQAKHGGIILLHDAQGNSKTVEALDTIIPELQAQGYEFVTVTGLFEAMGVTPEAHDRKIYTYADQQYMYG